MIQDSLIAGIWDTYLSDFLQIDPYLTLEKAKKTACQRDAVHE